MLEALELLVLAVAPWPLYRALTIASFRRFYRCFAVYTVTLLLLYAATVVSLAVFLPSLLHVATALALTGLAAERWRARSAYGKARRLPPGSLSLVPRGPRLDHRFYLKQARRHGPVFKISLFFKPTVCIVGAGLGHQLLQSRGAALRAPAARFSQFIPLGFLRYMEGSTHTHYRKILGSGFAPAVLENCDGGIRSDVRAALADLARSGARAGDGGISPRAALHDMLLVILLRLFFGLPAHDSAGWRFRQLYESINVRKAICRSARKEKAVAAEIVRLVRQQIAVYDKHVLEGRTSPSCVLARIRRQHPDALADETVLLNLVYMVQVARSDMTGLLMWILKMLGDHPEYLRQVRDQLDAGCLDETAPLHQLAALIVKETLRLEQSEFLSREATADIDFNGFTIPRGWLVRICIREGHRDPALFADPERFDPQRFVAHGSGMNGYSPLGMLGHSCIGAQIVSQVGQIFVFELARGFDLTLVADGPREFGADHWTPGSTFRINLQTRTRTRLTEDRVA